MKAHNPKRYTQDADGQWWYSIESNGSRGRCFPRSCPECGDEFLSYSAKKHCSRECGRRAWFKQNPDAFKGKRAGRWQGGRRIGRGGYVLVWKPDHPSLAGTKRKYVLEHRLVMEEHLGRLLQRGEQVHHRNGLRDDNRIENLELWAHQQPSGQRASEQQHCPTCTCHIARS